MENPQTAIAKALTRWAAITPEIAANRPGCLIEFFLDYARPKFDLRDSVELFTLICAHSPALAKADPGKIAIFKSPEEFSRGRRAAMKPGKAFKAMFPFASDSTVAEFVDSFRLHFPVAEYILKIGQSRSDFARAYTDKIAPYENPKTDCNRKSLANSCMRYTFSDISAHPAEVYASGDFQIAWLENPAGEIAGRVVIRTMRGDSELPIPAAGPVYGVSEQSLSMLETYLESINARFDCTWQGARLLRLPERGGLILPYLDCDPQHVSDCGGHLRICSEGEYSGSETAGLVYEESRYHCSDCGCGVDEDYMYSDDCGNCYCESCYDERFTFCPVCEDRASRGDMGSYYVVNRYGHSEERECCDWCRDRSCVECSDGEYWHEDHCQDTEDGYVSNPDLESNYFVCDSTGEYVLNEYRADLETGESVDLRDLDLDIWTMGEDSIWRVVQEELPLGVELNPAYHDWRPDPALPCPAPALTLP